jgi:hypothetical protein
MPTASQGPKGRRARALRNDDNIMIIMRFSKSEARWRYIPEFTSGSPSRAFTRKADSAAGTSPARPERRRQHFQPRAPAVALERMDVAVIPHKIASSLALGIWGVHIRENGTAHRPTRSSSGISTPATVTSFAIRAIMLGTLVDLVPSRLQKLLVESQLARPVAGWQHHQR